MVAHSRSLFTFLQLATSMFSCASERSLPGRCGACARWPIFLSNLEVIERGEASGARSSERDRPEERDQGSYAREVLERRRRSVLTCERGLRSALVSGDEHLARKWSRAMRDAEEGLVWAEADLQAAKTKAQSGVLAWLSRLIATLARLASRGQARRRAQRLTIR